MKECGVCECNEPPSWATDNVDWMPPTGPASALVCNHDDEQQSQQQQQQQHVDDRIVSTGVDARAAEGWTSTNEDLFSPSLMTTHTTNRPNLFPSSSYSSTVSSPSLPYGGGLFTVDGINDNDNEDRNDNDVENENENDDNVVVVDLRLNPERYTGYTGPSAEKVWSAIHSTNCFQPEGRSTEHKDDNKNYDGDDMYCSDLLPAEHRLYNRLLSGLHSSISLHIAHSYCLEVDKDRVGECKTWGPSVEIARERVLDHPNRVENLYVAYALLLRAVVKAGPAITAAVPRHRDDPYFDESLKEWNDTILPELTKIWTLSSSSEQQQQKQQSSSSLSSSSLFLPKTFDESIFDIKEHRRGNGDGREQALSRRIGLQRRFQHLQKIIRCIGCDRCKLWATLQTLGIGTALRVLFHNENDNNAVTAASADGKQQQNLDLSRQEAVALVHTLERLSSSLVFAQELGSGGIIGSDAGGWEFAGRNNI